MIDWPDKVEVRFLHFCAIKLNCKNGFDVGGGDDDDYDDNEWSKSESVS